MERVRKNSQKRNVIYDVLKNTKTHPTAEWVYMQVKPIIPNISLGTVYRNIAQFKEEGKLISVGVVNGQERFDADISPHTHFVCNKCGAVIDIAKLLEEKEITDDIYKKFGAKVLETNIVYKGYCQNCVENNT